MDSRRNFLRGLARAAAGAGNAAASSDARAGEDRAAAAPVPRTPTEEADAAATHPEGASRYAGGPTAGADHEVQAAIGRAAVLVIGAGALGAPVLGYLAATGVGRLGVLDDALVALSDLRAEILHYTPDVGVPKSHSATAKLAFLNPEIVIEPYQVRLAADNAEGLLAGQDLVVDCSNDEATQALVARTCARLGIPLVATTVGATGGRVVSAPGTETACPACAGLAASSPGHSPRGSTAGVLGSLQAHEALARLVAADEPPPARVLELQLEPPELRRSGLVRRPDCSVCGDR